MTKMSGSVECPKCGELFDCEKGMVNHHSAMTDKLHSDSIRKVDTDCEFCDSVVTYLPSQSESELKFCDASCRSKYFGEQMENKVTKNCDGCSKSFSSCPSNSRKYCSNSCYYKNGDIGTYTNSESISCHFCGDVFKRAKSKIEQSDKNFCSRNCRDSWVSETFVGENHHRWVDNSGNKYGNEWDESREKCIKRDFGRCRSCRMSRKEHQDEFNFDIHVHHKIPLRKFNNTEKANKMNNLITLCVSCHMSIESEIIGVGADA